jgi:RNA polymerase sigma-70 factor (ECF subfamily)
VEKRAFKRALYHVRDEESALDIVQDSMMRLAEHYGDKPPAELPMLFQRILSNCTLDWFRRQKTRNALFSSMATSRAMPTTGDFDLLEAWNGPEGGSRPKAPRTRQNGARCCATSKRRSGAAPTSTGGLSHALLGRNGCG